MRSLYVDHLDVDNKMAVFLDDVLTFAYQNNFEGFIIDEYGDLCIRTKENSQVRTFLWFCNPFAVDISPVDLEKDKTEFHINKLTEQEFVDWLEDYMVMCSI